MRITVACPTCGHRYDVPSRLAGKQVRCNECAGKFRVPVPVTLPEQPRRKRRKAEPSAEFESVSAMLDSEGIAAEPSDRPRTQPTGLVPDWGKSWGYLLARLGLFSVLGLAWLLNLASPFTVVLWGCLFLAGFLLLPVFGGWPSFEESPRSKFVARFLGGEGPSAVRLTVAVALCVFAVLLGIGAIQIAALDPEPVPAPTVAEPAAAPEG